jgi:hypothetical protein
LARHIDGNRYCCGLTDAVVRGNWEAKTDCYHAVASETESLTAQPEETPAAQLELHQEVTALPAPAPKTFNHPFRYRADIFNGQHSFSSAMYRLCECDRCVPVAQPITKPVVLGTVITTTTDDTPPNRGDNGRGRVTVLTALQAATIVLPHATPKADDNFMTAFIKEGEFERKLNDLAYLSQLEMEAQLAIERTVIGSEDEAIAYAHLRQIERDIEFYDRPEPAPEPSPVIKQLEIQMNELKADVLSLFKITAFDPSILPDADELKQPATKGEPEPEGTIHWTMPLLRGVIVGKKGATRHFYIRNDEIFIVLSGEFTASETKHPNIRHRQIREAINLGRTFDPRIFKVSPNFEQDTQACNGGRICQKCDGRWWAWANGNPTGHPFFDRETACKYLKKVSQNQRQELARKSVICAK